MADKKKEQCYVVYGYHRYQDGSEETCELFGDGKLDQALQYIQHGMNEINGCNSRYYLFELGKEIPLSFVKETVPQPPPPPKEIIVVSLAKKE